MNCVYDEIIMNVCASLAPIICLAAIESPLDKDSRYLPISAATTGLRTKSRYAVDTELRSKA
jgi:hypothetical protein